MRKECNPTPGVKETVVCVAITFTYAFGMQLLERNFCVEGMQEMKETVTR